MKGFIIGNFYIIVNAIEFNGSAKFAIYIYRTIFGWRSPKFAIITLNVIVQITIKVPSCNQAFGRICRSRITFGLGLVFWFILDRIWFVFVVLPLCN